MNTLNREESNIAIAEWVTCCGNYTMIKSLIPTNQVFSFDAEEIDWVIRANKNTEFSTHIGVYKSQLIAILHPLDADGYEIVMDTYPYSPLQELKEDLRLVETEKYTIVKNAVLSKELRKIDDNSDMFLPVSNKPVLPQDKAVTAIEAWRDEAMDWFYKECEESKGNGIFKKFYTPSQDLKHSDKQLSYIICSFGLKFSDVYQRMLPTLIFISFYKDTANTGSLEKISNTYDWSTVCPPRCQL
ncbi:hypothetical protein [uncultured Chryseobacterium sp.]|uniref:hypothetical protein n=1 Tax=uncultured Chryseobacterium sp. TaxID=259322 RepID=UPI0025FF7A4C|nr:hypothetical protein [uncultured Chryseobacterium sp.]